MFRIPNDAERTVVVGMTGSGKTQGASFLLSRMNYAEMPWVVFDFKREAMFEEMALFPLTSLQAPRDPGIYIDRTGPGDLENIETLMLDIHARGDCGMLIDEGMELGHSRAFRTVLTQGRSLRIPIITCSQRPAHVTLSVFTEANFFMVYDLTHPDDEKLIAGYLKRKKPPPPLPRYHFYWYEVVEKTLLQMRPVPERDRIINTIRTQQESIARAERSRIYL